MTDTKAMLKLLLETQKQITFIPEYRASATDEETLGILVAHFFEWDGFKIMQVCLNALEDANFHTLGGKVEELVTSYFKEIN